MYSNQSLYNDQCLKTLWRKLKVLDAFENYFILVFLLLDVRNSFTVKINQWHHINHKQMIVAIFILFSKMET